MRIFTGTFFRRIAWGTFAFVAAMFVSLWLTWRADPDTTRPLSNGELFTRVFAIPAVFTAVALTIATALATRPAGAETVQVGPVAVQPAKPFMAQVVGLQWLNPLQRMDYPTEWQLLWTLGLVGPNPNDDMVRAKPEKYGKLRAVGAIAVGNEGRETVKGYHKKYLESLLYLYRDIYFMDSDYFYNAHSRTDKSTWRELAGIHVEYALPEGKLDPVQAATALRSELIACFDIGNPSFPKSWSRSTPPDVRVTMGGPNAGFTSLAAGLDYLQTHPTETVWVMNWDAPNFPPDDEQINENMVQLILAGPDYKTGRAPLAWLGYPASTRTVDFDAGEHLAPRTIQAWKAALGKAADNAGKRPADIGFVIHDAGNGGPKASERLATLARTVTEQLPELDFMQQTFNTTALLGETGAGTALTNVALGIAYANHLGKTVLVAGTSEETQAVATLVVPPAVVRPIRRDQPWFRARGGNTAYLPWWGLRHGDPDRSQGYSR
jgi:hypothetical protein